MDELLKEKKKNEDDEEKAEWEGLQRMEKKYRNRAEGMKNILLRKDNFVMMGGTVTLKVGGYIIVISPTHVFNTTSLQLKSLIGYFVPSHWGINYIKVLKKKS